MTASLFSPGDRVIHKRKRELGTLVSLHRHTNNSPRWLVRYDYAAPIAFLTWEIDLLPAPVQLVQVPEAVSDSPFPCFVEAAE